MDSRKQPPQTVRIKLPKLAARFIFGPIYGALRRDHPEVQLELILDDALADLTTGGFDAGIRSGEYVRPGIVPIPITGDIQSAIVGSPAYLDGRELPTEPRDLRGHDCIAFRWAQTGKPYPWALSKGRQTLEVDPVGPLICNDFDAMLDAALDGAGLIWTLEPHVRPHVEAGRLISVMEDWCQKFPPYYLYYLREQGMSDGLRTVVDYLRQRLHEAG